MASEIQQALYGYSDGHGLLAASQRIDPRATRELWSFTDMAFDGTSDQYLSCFPVEALRQQALVRTWPAPESSRPGSVWSHVLFIDFVDLGEIASLQDLLKLFRYPEIDGSGSPKLKPYQSRITLSAVRNNGGDTQTAGFADTAVVLWAAYGGDSNGVVQARDPVALEASLVAIWEQQWPRLRRAFRFRTRYRVSAQHSDAFDVQVVERLAREQPRVHLPDPEPAWVARLAEDLIQRDGDLRRFLRRFGAESDNGRADIGPLVDIQGLLLARGKRKAVTRRVWEAFPRGAQMTALKRALFGSADEHRDLWSAPEQERLRFVLEASPPAAVDLNDLKVEQRLDVLWETKPTQAAALVVATYQDGAMPTDELLAGSALKHAHGRQIAALADEHPALALTVMRERPEQIASPELWTGSRAARELVADLLAQADSTFREEVLLDLLNTGSYDAAGRVVEQQPQLWWRALKFQAQQVATAPNELEQCSDLLRRLLEMAGPAAVGSKPAGIGGTETLQLLAVTCAPQAGLWRQAESHEWAEHAEELASIRTEAPRLRALVVLLLATRLAGSAEARRRLWLAAFGPLHAALAGNRLRSPDWEALETVLPSGDHWDRCDRLRRAAVEVIARDKWPAWDAQRIVQGAHPFEERVLALIQASRRKRKGWLRELVDELIG